MIVLIWWIGFIFFKMLNVVLGIGLLESFVIIFEFMLFIIFVLFFMVLIDMFKVVLSFLIDIFVRDLIIILCFLIIFIWFICLLGVKVLFMFESIYGVFFIFKFFKVLIFKWLLSILVIFLFLL